MTSAENPPAIYQRPVELPQRLIQFDTTNPPGNESECISFINGTLTAEIDVTRYDPGPAEPDLRLFDLLADILKEADPNGLPIPLLLGGVTDGRFFSRLGIQTYGFLPMLLPEGFNFTQTIHSADERVPVDAIEFGANAIYQALQRIGA